MRSLGTINEKDIDANGNFRRKYQLDDSPESRAGSKFAVGLLFANALIVIKQIFFSPEADASGDDDTERRSTDTIDSGLSPEKPFKTPSLKLVESQKPTGDQDGSLDDFKPSRVGDKPSQFDRGNAGETNVANSGSSTVQGSGVSIGSNVVAFPIQLITPDVVQAALPPSASDTVSSPAGGAAKKPDNRADTGKTEPNRLPVVTGPVVLSSLYVNQSVVIGMSSLLQGAHDPDGDQLYVPNLTATSGELVQLADNKWKFTADLHDDSHVTFHYTISDAEGSVAQVANLDLLPIPGADFTGTEFSDLIIGTAGQDRVDARAGDDDILTREGDDVIIAGEGNDRVVAGPGDDTINTGAGDDVVFAGAGNDFVSGGDGDDWLDGEDGDDNLLGEAGNDTILAGKGSDAAFGDTGNDSIWGGEGDDLVDGGPGDDYLSGGDGSDVIIGGQGADTIEGGAGDDVVVATVLDGDDHVDGGDGIDTFDISGTSEDALIDLTLGLASSAEIGNDSITGFENVRGGGGDDVIVDNEAANKLTGNGGNDIFVFLESSKSGKGGHIRDRIEDFEVGDKIDLTGIDGNSDEEGWQPLVFNFDQATSFEHVGQAIYRYEGEESNTVTLIRFNFHDDDDDDDDDEADYEIAITGRHELDDTNIIT